MATNITGVRHVGLSATDPLKMSQFYQDVMGMKVVAQMPANSPMGAMVFLSRHPGTEEHHDLALFSSPMLAYTAFRVDALDDFLALYQEVKEKGVPIRMTFNHGASFAFYFLDPEGHNIEIYWPTYANVPLDYQPQPINLDLSKEEVQQVADRMAEQYGHIAKFTSN
jgi:catechol-2,3-dioxygenase